MRRPSSSSGTEVEIESRDTGGAPIPTSATWASFHIPVTRRNSGSSPRVDRIAGDGMAWANRKCGRPRTRSARARVISLVWCQASGSETPPTVGPIATPGSTGSVAWLSSCTVRPEDTSSTSPGVRAASRNASPTGSTSVRPRSWPPNGASHTRSMPSSPASRSRCASTATDSGSCTVIRTNPMRRASDSSRLTVGRETESRSAIAAWFSSSR